METLVYAMIENGKVVDYRMKEIVDGKDVYNSLKSRCDEKGYTIEVLDIDNLLVEECYQKKLKEDLSNFEL